MVLPDSHEVSRASQYSGTACALFGFGYGTITRCGVAFQPASPAYSKIAYGAGGESHHLTFADETFGPDYQPLAELIDEYGLTPFVVCESDGTMADDAVLMKNMHKNV